MNLNFTEIDNLGNKDDTLNNYWEAEPIKKKKVSYDDILNSLNLVVNKSGVLQYMSLIPNQEEQHKQLYKETDYQENTQYHQQSHKSDYQQNTQYHNQIQKPKMTNNTPKPLDPQIKNSHIFNKYFKNYKDPNVEEEVEQVKTPKTMTEYKQMVLEENLKRIQERNRISKIKSTKILFENNNTNIRASKNNLRMMKF
jgi:hypothetical protein